MEMRDPASATIDSTGQGSNFNTGFGTQKVQQTFGSGTTWNIDDYHHIHGPSDGVSQTYQEASASGYARQHNGNVYNHNTHQYTGQKRPSDEILQQSQRNNALLRAAADGQTQRVSYLIRLGAVLDYGEYRGFTALHYAAMNGFEDTVEVLLAAGCDVNALSMDHGMPLHPAAISGRENVVHKLLSYRAHLDATSCALGSPLHCAAMAASCAIATVLIEKGADVRMPCWVKEDAAGTLSSDYLETVCWYYEDEPLHCAVKSGDSALVQFLLDHGASVDARSSQWKTIVTGQYDELSCSNDHNIACLDQVTALMYASANGHTHMCETLIRNSAVVDAQDRLGRTALHAAAFHGHVACVNTLLKAKALLELLDEGGQSALRMAVKQCHVKCITSLCDWGQKVNIRDYHHATPLHLAAGNGDHAAMRLLLDFDAEKDALDVEERSPLHAAVRSGNAGCVRLLIDLEARVDLVDTSGWTVLLWAVHDQNLEIAHLLLQFGADPNPVTSGERTPLLIAAHESCEELVRLLLDHGADRAAADATNRGMTVLHYSSCQGHTDLVRLLIDAGANLNTPDSKGYTALHLAAEWGELEVVRILLKAGADICLKNHDGFTPEYVEPDPHVVSDEDHKEIRRLLEDARNKMPIELSSAEVKLKPPIDSGSKTTTRWLRSRKCVDAHGSGR